MPVTIPHWLIPETATLVLDAANPLLKLIEELLFNGPKPQEITIENARTTRRATVIACIAARILLVQHRKIGRDTQVFNEEGALLSAISDKLLEISEITAVAPMASEFTALGHLVLNWRNPNKPYDETSTILALVSQLAKSLIRNGTGLPVPANLLTMDVNLQQTGRIREIGELFERIMPRREVA